MLPNHILKTFIFVSPKTGPAPLNVAEYERYAADTLSRNAHGYYASGSNDMITLRENRDAYSRLRLMPKILVDVSSVSTGTNLILLSFEMNCRLQGIQNVPTSLYNILSPDASLDQLTESDISMTSTIISDFAIDNSNSFCSRKAHLLT